MCNAGLVEIVAMLMYYIAGIPLFQLKFKSIYQLVEIVAVLIYYIARIPLSN